MMSSDVRFFISSIKMMLHSQSIQSSCFLCYWVDTPKYPDLSDFYFSLKISQMFIKKKTDLVSPNSRDYSVNTQNLMSVKQHKSIVISTTQRHTYCIACMHCNYIQVYCFVFRIYQFIGVSNRTEIPQFADIFMPYRSIKGGYK